MSEYISCLSDPARPGHIELMASRDDPRLERGEGFAMLRERHWPTLEWVLPVVDRTQTMKALSRDLQAMHRGGGIYACHPMDARGKAIALTTLRAAPPKPSLLRRLGMRKGAA